jgi:hypothetical protein
MTSPHRFWSALALVLIAGWAQPASAQQLLLNTFNTATVVDRLQGPPNQTWFGTFNSQAFVSQIATYHWHNGAGARAGTISLRAGNGQIFGPYPASGQPGQNGAQSVTWVATMNVVIPAGYYVILDSDPSTWSYNSYAPSNGSGFAKVTGFFNYTTQPPQPAQPPRPTSTAKPPYQSWGYPSINGFPVGQCYYGTGVGGVGADCSGKDSANAFCRAEGYSSALQFQAGPVPFPKETRALGDGAVCNITAAQSRYYTCSAVTSVTCQR